MAKSKSLATKKSAPSVNTDCRSSGCNECGCEDVNVELSGDMSYDNYLKGVSFTTLGSKVQVTYNGLLANSGAQEVYAVIGFGDNNNWKNVSTFPMKSKNRQMYEISIPSKDAGQINVAFKDSADNWDNNSGKNYSYYVQ